MYNPMFRGLVSERHEERFRNAQPVLSSEVRIGHNVGKDCTLTYFAHRTFAGFTMAFAVHSYSCSFHVLFSLRQVLPPMEICMYARWVLLASRLSLGVLVLTHRSIKRRSSWSVQQIGFRNPVTYAHLTI